MLKSFSIILSLNFAKNKTALRFYFFILLYCLQPLIGAAQTRIPYEFRHLTISNGLPDNTVYSCHQDAQGYIWFCTSNGVARFDGRKFQNFSVLQGLADNEIIAATEDFQGRIWFHSLNGRLSYFDTKTEQIVSYRTSAGLQKANGSAYITSIVEGSDSSIWILYERLVLKRWMPNGDVRQYDIKNKQVLGIFQDEQKRIYTLGDTFRLFDNQKDAFIDWFGFATEKNIKPSGKFFYNNKALYFDTSDSIFEFSNGSYKKITSKDLFKNQLLLSLSGDTLGNLRFGVTNGFYTFDLNNKKPPHFHITNAHVSHTMTDREGNQWVCTMGEGLLFFPAGYDHIMSISKDKGLESEVVTALAKSPQGDIVAATYPNVLNFWDKNKEKVVRKLHIHGKWDVRIERILYPNEKDFWLLTDNYRLDFFPDFLKKYPPQYLNEKNQNYEVLPLDFTFSKRTKQQNAEYTTQELLTLLSPFKNFYFAKNGRFYTVSSLIAEATPRPNNLWQCRFLGNDSPTRFYTITEDAKGVIWFGGTEGVCFLRPNSENLEYLKENFETSVNDMVVLSDDYLLCSTSGNGIFLLKNGKILKNWQEKDGLSSNNCNRMLKLNEQMVFVATSKGVTRFNFDPNDPTNMLAIIYGGKDAKPSLYVNDLLLDGEQLYVATNEGLYTFKINDLKIQKNRPLLRLTQPLAYLIQPDTFLQLRYGWFNQENGIKFNYRAIAFLNGEMMHFRYRLFRDGALIKNDSTELVEDFTLSFASLNSGSYMLEVESSRGDGFWSKPVRTRFEVPKAIYRKTIAIFFYWLAFAFLTFEVLRWRNKLRSRKEQSALAFKEERLVLERRQLEWEQEAVRARIDPHFVFNALNGILTFVYKRDLEALKMQLPRLARFIRLSLNLGREDFITIDQETRYLNDYLSLEKSRFEEQFDYSIKITEGVDTRKKFLPPLLLQIFVENAIKHGVSNVPLGETGVISIVFEQIETKGVHCVITDNGMGLSKSLSAKKDTDVHQSLGLNLAKRRISLLNQIYGEKYKLQITDDAQGTKVEIWINS